MESLKQKTESTDTDQQKSSLGNASFSPSESVLHTLGKDSSQELHDKFMHCTFKPAAKRAFRYVPASRKSKEQAKKTAEQACCCSWVSTISFKWYSKGIRAKMFQPGNSFTVTSLKVRIGTMVTKTSEMSKRTGQIHHLVFWLVRIKKQQLKPCNLLYKHRS